MNIWEHLKDETTPQCMKDYIWGICKLRHENPGLMMHTRWRTVATFFYNTCTEQHLTHRYSHSESEDGLCFATEKEVPPGFYAFTLTIYDGGGSRMRLDLYNSEGVNERKITEYGNNISIKCQHLLRKEPTYYNGTEL